MNVSPLRPSQDHTERTPQYHRMQDSSDRRSSGLPPGPTAPGRYPKRCIRPDYDRGRSCSDRVRPTVTLDRFPSEVHSD